LDLPFLSADQQPILQSVLRLAQTCEYDAHHTLQVTRLAVQLFEEFQPYHHLLEADRLHLVYAGILHDIGWIEGQHDHHRTSLRIILTTSMLTFTNKERLIIGSIARYHRKSLPDPKHDHFAALDSDEQIKVSIMASFLRLADALDRTHRQRVKNFSCRITPKRITLTCQTAAPASEEYQAALQKGDLLQKLYQRKLVLVGLV
jgi:exopolyphosphatase/pppGpp-phosphohydrolase